MTFSAQTFDVAGIGIGPFNLSLAALLEPCTELRARFFEARAGFDWHAGLMFRHATLQSPYLKDLVTLVDPTSRFSFLNYLAREHRLYRFIVASYENVPRREYDRYFKWACRQLDSLQFSSRVEHVEFRGDNFQLHVAGRNYRARNIVLGIGREPNIPDAAVPYLGDTVFHGSEYLTRTVATCGKSVLVIGGGQTGAEIFYDLITNPASRPRSVTWMTRRHNFVPFDESAFANELYLPGYAKAFYRQAPAQRERLLDQQKYSSDAILAGLLLDIYRRLYEFDCLDDAPLTYRLLTDRHLIDMTSDRERWRVVTEGAGTGEVTYADIVVLATGLRYQVPRMLAPISSRIEWDERGYFALNEDFSARWDGPSANRIYAHNAGLYSHGWIDPNFAGMAWRSAVIINSLLGRSAYDLGDTATMVDWAGGTAVKAARELSVAQ
jgi:lysine N6-hydroxylase